MKKKGINTTKTGFSIDTDVYREFERVCDEHSINRSKLITNLIKDYVNSQKRAVGDRDLLK